MDARTEPRAELRLVGSAEARASLVLQTRARSDSVVMPSARARSPFITNALRFWAVERTSGSAPILASARRSVLPPRYSSSEPE